MFRVLKVLSVISVLIAGVVAQAHAEPFAKLDQASQTATLERDGMQLIAFYTKRGAILDLTVLITDAEGEALRTRIGLRNRQHHTLVLPRESDRFDATRIEFMRTGERIEMVVSDQPELSEYTASQIYTHF